ncbi:MAG: sugar ABC transporter ATP-binding protein, partial [Tabrizicola sp.]|nr:sugar ABC transporter ATP-binding protein [Tabrizicola sp.]
MPDAAAVLDATGVAKRFGAVVALKNASLQVAAGQVVALMGANGAGKSTFVKILTGVLKPDAGHVRIKGRDSTVANPAGARKWGLVPVYQEPSLIPDLSVADNLRLGDTGLEPFRHWVAELGLPDLAPEAMIRSLPLASLRIVDLARALALEPDVLLLDELTAALPTDLVDRVLKVVRTQADGGRSVIYVSHRFNEIAAICDRATVLRDGLTVGDVKIEPGIEERIVEMMLGGAVAAAVSEERPVKPIPSETPRLRVRSLKTGTRLSDVSFDLHQGEVLGVVALEGQGQDELFDTLAGNRKPSAGTVQVDGAPKTFAHPADAIAAGLTLVPGDRAHALLMSRSVRENIAVPLLARVRNWGAIRMRDEAAKVDKAIDTLQIDTRALGELRRLSGANQQKGTIARWIAKGVHTILLIDHTRRIDIRTIRELIALVRDLAD